jgi:hypothetical protein
MAGLPSLGTQGQDCQIGNKIMQYYFVSMILGWNTNTAFKDLPYLF